MNHFTRQPVHQRATAGCWCVRASSFVGNAVYAKSACTAYVSSSCSYQNGSKRKSGGSTHQHSNEHHAITAGGHVSVATAKSWLVSAKDAVRMFSYNTGIKLISAATNIDAQALSKSLHVLAKLRVTQSADTITFTAQEELRIKAGGSFTTLSASGITHGTAGQWDVKAATQGIQTVGKSAAVVMPELPHAELEEISMKKTMDLFYHYPDMSGVAGASYRVVFANGEVREGKLNEHGKATLQNVPNGVAQIYYGETTKTQAPETPSFGKPATDEQIRADLQKLGLHASDGQNIDQLLAQMTGRNHD
ncbi:DUF2345 domain-containing protein [Curvibacter sp. CHRR-16]|nr:DUF2345 domain-containing protein [Curvibacter sp. CHRR-16]